MKIIDRKKAIRWIYYQSNKRRWSNDYLHAMIEQAEIIDFPSIAIMTPLQLKQTLERLFGIKTIVREDKMVYALREYCSERDIPFSIVQTLIRHIWKNYPKITSVYHLNNKQIFTLRNKIVPWLEAKNSESYEFEEEKEIKNEC